MAAHPADSQKKSSRRLDPLDLFDVRSLLSEEEQMVKDSVGRMVDEKVLPIIREHFENHTFPAELVGELAHLRLRPWTVGIAAGVTDVHDVLVGQQIDDGARDRQPAETTVEHADRSIHRRPRLEPGERQRVTSQAIV